MALGLRLGKFMAQKSHSRRNWFLLNYRPLPIRNVNQLQIVVSPQVSALHTHTGARRIRISESAVAGSYDAKAMISARQDCKAQLDVSVSATFISVSPRGT